MDEAQMEQSEYWTSCGDRRLVHGQHSRRRVGAERVLRRRVHLRGRQGRVPRDRLHALRPPAGTAERHVPPGGQPGGLLGAPGRGAADRRGPGAPAEGLGLLPLAGRDRPHPRRRGGGPVHRLRDRRAQAGQTTRTRRSTSATRPRSSTARARSRTRPTTRSPTRRSRSGSTARRRPSRASRSPSGTGGSGGRCGPTRLRESSQQPRGGRRWTGQGRRGRCAQHVSPDARGS